MGTGRCVKTTKNIMKMEWLTIGIQLSILPLNLEKPAGICQKTRSQMKHKCKLGFNGYNHYVKCENCGKEWFSVTDSEGAGLEDCPGKKEPEDAN